MFDKLVRGKFTFEDYSRLQNRSGLTILQDALMMVAIQHLTTYEWDPIKALKHVMQRLRIPADDESFKLLLFYWITSEQVGLPFMVFDFHERTYRGCRDKAATIPHNTKPLTDKRLKQLSDSAEQLDTFKLAANVQRRERQKRYAPYEPRHTLFTLTFSDTCLIKGFDAIDHILLMEIEKHLRTGDTVQLSRLHTLREDYLERLMGL